MNDSNQNRRHLEFADFSLYPHERLLTRHGERVPLTPRVLDLLIILVEHSGELVSRETLLNSIWGDSFVEESNISRAMSTLRKSLGTQSNGSDLIETVPKLGYRFIAPVPESTIATEKLDEQLEKTGNRTTVWIVGIFVVLAVAAGFWFFVRAKSRPIAINGLTNLTNSIGEDNLPAWSPDGSKVSFTSNRDGTGDIYVMNSDGSGVKRLTSSDTPEYTSKWSPDGTKIAFDSDRDGNREIYIMNTDGSDQRRLTFNATSDNGPVSFSPDGMRLAYARNASENGGGVYNFDIFVMNSDGSDVRQLTTDPEFDAEPLWSPDGSTIYFTSGRKSSFEVFAIGADGSGEVNVSNTADASDGPFGFSADGKQIFCTSNSPDRVEFIQIWSMNVNGGDRRQITSFVDKVYRVAYSPEAGKFAVSSKKDGNFDIYTLDATVPSPK